MKRFITLCVLIGIPYLSFSQNEWISQKVPKDILKEGFQNPPDSVRPQTWWHWMNGNITKEGITADLEAMKEVGLGGAQIFNVTCGIPKGPVNFMSAEWRGLVQHAINTADSLGLEIGLQNCAGWATSGGPWITPEHAMKRVVWTELDINGSNKDPMKLKQPFTLHSYYHDIAVLAFPTPKGDRVPLSNNIAAITTPFTKIADNPLIDNDFNTGIEIPESGTGTGDKDRYIDIEFKKLRAFSAITLKMYTNWGRYHIELYASMDGDEYKRINIDNPFPGSVPGMVDNIPLFLSVSFEKQEAKYLRLAFTPFQKNIKVLELELHGNGRIDQWPGKSAIYRLDNPSMSASQPILSIDKNSIIDLTSKMKPDGRLDWDAPKGDWTIVRLGYTVTGKTNHPAPEEGKGLECDKMSRQALEVHFNGMMKELINDNESHVGNTLKYAIIDSYEADGQNWTPAFQQEFKRLRGYELLPWLLTLTGRSVGSAETSERFLWDFRRTIADLYKKNYYQYFTELCRRHGLKTYIEGYGNGTFDNFANGSCGDIVMGEFWTQAKVGKTGARPNKEASSIAHTYGKNIVAAESFTAKPHNAGWRNYPYVMKASGDHAFCMGINQFVFHTYTHQPWSGVQPGMTMGHYGFHFGRTTTWWDFAPAWIDYITRSQFMLQSGRFVADICLFAGENVPSGFTESEQIPEGYDYDGCNAEIILDRMHVSDGKITVVNGPQYEILVLPDTKAMTLAMIEKLEQLVSAGAIVYGPKPTHSPSMADAGDGEIKLHKIADKVWGGIDGKTVLEHSYGQGKLLWGMSLEEALQGLDIAPDFTYTGNKNTEINMIHRRHGESDIYFVANPHDHKEITMCTFRIKGKVPQIWHPNAGIIEDVPFYEIDDRTMIPLTFEPSGSFFVVFSNDKPKNQDVSLHLEGPWQLRFPANSGAPGEVTLPVLTSWTAHEDSGVRYFSGTATYKKEFQLPDTLSPGTKAYLDLGEVNYIARVRLNDHDLGILWTKPFEVELTDVMVKGNNILEIEVANLWGNRLVGDEQENPGAETPEGDTANRPDISKRTKPGIPENRYKKEDAIQTIPGWVQDGAEPPGKNRYTFTTWKHYRKDSGLSVSGLLGPVKVILVSSN